MGKTAFAKISGVPWSVTAESAYTVIMENVQIRYMAEEHTLDDEAGDFQVEVQSQAHAEVTCDATIKGANHFGKNGIRGSVLTSMTDTEIPGPLVVTENSLSKTKRDWQKCSMTLKYFGAGFTTGTLVTTFTTTTSA